MNPASVGEHAVAENALKLGDDTNIVGVGAVKALGPVEQRLPDGRVADLVTRLEDFVKYFSHLWGKTVTVGVLEEHHESWDDPAACVAPRNYIIFVRPSRRLSNRTLFHELAHLEIHKRAAAGHDVPRSSEEFCDIYAMARMPPHLVDTDGFAYLGKPSVPSDEWPRICRRALEYREESHDYIKQCKAWLGVAA